MASLVPTHGCSSASRRGWGGILRAACIAAFAVATLAGATASERVPVTRPTDDASLSAATHQLEAMKANAATAASGTNAGALPPVGLPQLQTSQEPSSGTARPAPATSNDGKASTNWLVDAMMTPKTKRPDGRERERQERRASAGRGARPDAVGQTGELPDLERGRNAGAELAAKDGTAGGASAEGQSRLAPTEQAALNPFTRYLAGWLSPQDNAVLSRTMSGANLGTSGGDRAAAGGLPTAGGSTRDSAVAFGPGRFPIQAVPPAAAAKPAENPYLQAFTLPESSPSPTAAVAQPSPQPVVQPVPPPVVPEAAPTPKAPDLSKPANDDKYFKPLKRF